MGEEGGKRIDVLWPVRECIAELFKFKNTSLVNEEAVMINFNK